MRGLLRLIKRYEEVKKESEDRKDKIIKKLSSDLYKILPSGDLHEREGIHFNDLRQEFKDVYKQDIPSKYVQEALDKMKDVSEVNGYYLKRK